MYGDIEDDDRKIRLFMRLSILIFKHDLEEFWLGNNKSLKDFEFSIEISKNFNLIICHWFVYFVLFYK